MSMSTQPVARSSKQPLGTSGDLRRRFFLHHLPLAVASAVVLVFLMSLPLNLDHGGGQMGSMNHEGGHNGMMHHGGGHNGTMHHGGGHHAAQPQFIVATGYLALGFIALTLLIGPANLLLRRRTPVSNYLSRDVGAWAVIASVVHTIFVLQAPGSGRTRDVLAFFFLAPDGKPLLNSFGLGNWTGLAALVIVVGLLAISSDVALGKLKAGPWKRLQRLNYALFALVILHAFFYGALLRVRSPFTLLLGVSIVAVFVGQAVGVWLWRRKYISTAAA